MAVFTTEEEARGALTRLDDGHIPFTLSNGVVRSSKEMYRLGATFAVFHDIDGTVTEFSEDHAVAVLLGTRSPWDGTPGLNDDDEGDDDE